MKYVNLIHIIFDLMAHDVVTASDLCNKYGISHRSVYRYMNEISEIVPVYSVRGPGGGYAIADDFRINSTFLTEKEFKIILQALSAVRGELPGGEVDSAYNKITAVSKSSATLNLGSASLMIDSGPWGITAEYTGRLRVLEECVANRTPVSIKYYDVNGLKTERVIEPHVIILKQGIWYVYAFCRLRKEFRLFKVGRIEREIVLEGKFERKNVGDLKKVLSAFPSAVGETVVMEIDDGVVSEVEEWLGVGCISRVNGVAVARAILPVNGGLISRILGFGGKVKVTAPIGLKKMVREAAEDIIAKYRDNA